MTNLDQCLRDGFSTGGSPGQGLGAIVRLSTASDIYTLSGQGTAVLARWPASGQRADRAKTALRGRGQCLKPDRRCAGMPGAREA